jgi:hypothetical protein
MTSYIVVTSQHVLYYCTYYSVSFTYTVHCTYYIYCTLYIQYMFPVSLFPMLRFHPQHLFTLLFTLISCKFFLVHLCSLITCVHTALILTELLLSAWLSVCAPHHLGVTTISILVYTILIFDFTIDHCLINEATFLQRCQRIQATRERSLSYQKSHEAAHQSPCQSDREQADPPQKHLLEIHADLRSPEPERPEES